MRPATAKTHIANLLREKIRTGYYPAQSQLPAETELAAQFGVARNTVRNAIELLVHEGLVKKSQGRRSIVQFPRPAARQIGGKLAWFSNLQPSAMYCNQIYFELFQRMVQLAQGHGLSVHFFNPASISDWSPEAWHAPEWRGLFSVGVASSQEGGAYVAQLQALPNLISIDENDGNPGKFVVTTDNYTSARIVTMHLLEAGCQTPAFVKYDTHQGRSFRERQSGFETIIRETSGESAIRVFTLACAGKSFFQAYKSVEDFLQNRGSIDGVFCATDEIAMQMAEAAHRYQVKIPEELKIVGFDGTYAGQHSTPRITTISQPLNDIAQNALSLALELRGGSHRAPCTIKLPGYLLRGETT